MKTESEIPKCKTRQGFILKFIRFVFFTSVILLVLLISAKYLFTSYNTAPNNFPTNTQIVIDEGSDVREITTKLQSEGVVRSDDLLYYVLVLLHDPTTIKASTYVFEEPLSTLDIAQRLTEGDFDTNLLKLTHYEGERVSQLAKRMSGELENFDEVAFVKNAEPLEGKLFPDTYFVPPNFTDEDLLSLMLETFTAKTASLEQEISLHKLTLDEILVLASIIEREANTKESKRLVSSVLQNRIEIGMALQADASIEYVLDKPLSELTPKDLEIDSPYNTYLYPGLPPTSIGNPGLDAINAVLDPSDSEYFYYITDEEGVFHYAETYRQHLINIEKYLR